MKLKEKKIVVLLIIFIMLMVFNTIVKAESTSYPITLQQIADKLNAKQISENVEKYYAIEGKVSTTINVEENKLNVILDKENDSTLEIIFTLKDGILSSPRIDSGINGDMIINEKIKYMITENIINIITELMGYDSNVVYHARMEKYTLEKEGIKILSEDNGNNGTYYTYQIDLRKKATIYDLQLLNKVEHNFEKNCAPSLAATSELSETIKVNWTESGDIAIIGFDKDMNEKEKTILTLDGTVLTTEVISVIGSNQDMLSKDKFIYWNVLNFIDCIGQETCGYQEGELLNTITEDGIQNYSIKNQGFEVIKISSDKWQYKIDIAKKVPLISTEQENNKSEKDDTQAPGKIPQTGENVIVGTTVLAAIAIIGTTAYIKYKKYNDVK